MEFDLTLNKDNNKAVVDTDEILGDESNFVSVSDNDFNDIYETSKDGKFIVDGELYAAFTSIDDFKRYVRSFENDKYNADDINSYDDIENMSSTFHVVDSLKDFEDQYGKVRCINPKDVDEAFDAIGLRG